MADITTGSITDSINGKYRVLYKLYTSQPSTPIDKKGMDVLVENVKFSAVVDFHKYYDVIADSIDVWADGYTHMAYCLEAIDGSTVTNNNVVVSELKPHQYKYILTGEFEGGIKYFVGIRTFYHIEHADFKYYIDRIEFDKDPATIQHIDFVLTDANENVVNTTVDNLPQGTTAVETIGNVILYVSNVAVDRWGRFIISDADRTLKRFDLAKRYNVDGIEVGVQNKQFDEDTKYNLYVYHREQNKVFTKHGYTPIKIYVGDNPLWKKVCYQDGTIELYTNVDINAAAQPSITEVKWYFDLSASTHGIGASGGIQYPIPETQVTDFHFVERATKGFEEEKYNGMGIDKGNFIFLPNAYVKEEFPNKGFTSNVWTNDIFGNIDLNRLHYLENGEVAVNTQGQYIDKYGVPVIETANTYRTLFFKFYIEDINTNDVTIIDALNGTNGAKFTFKVNVPKSKIIIANTTNYLYDKAITINNQPLKYNKWYTAILVIQHGHIIAVNINDAKTYTSGGSEVNSGFGIFPGTEDSAPGHIDIKRIGVDKTTTINVTYKLTGGAGGSNEIGIVPIITSYRYGQDNELLETNKVHEEALLILESSDTFITKSVSVDHGGYSIIPGIKIVNTKGDSTTAKTLTIQSITVGGTTYDVQHPLSGDIKLDEGCNVIFANANANTNIFNDIQINKTANAISNPIGGYWDTNMDIDMSIVSDDTLNSKTFQQKTNRVYVGTADGQTRGLIVAKLGLRISYLNEAFSVAKAGDVMPASLMKKLGGGYKLFPKVVFEYNDGNKVEISTSKYKEVKANKIWAILPATLPVGKVTVKIYAGTTELYAKPWEVRSVKPDDNHIDFEIDFSKDFDAAIKQFKERFYIRQEKRAGDLSGGENGHLVYFSRGEQAAVFENHGDLYDGDICCNEKNSGVDLWYGAVAPQVKIPLNEDGSVKLYTDKHKIDPLKPRTTRVGSLVQSKDYYGYGEFEIDIKIPRGFKGEALCWWMFHYQELYYPMDKERYDFYVGGNDGVKGDDNAVVTYNVGNKKAKWNYLHSFKIDNGMPYLIINNEIDMELGSEATDIVTDKNPNNDSSVRLYLPLIDPHTVIACKTPGENFGLWVIDWDASQPVLQQYYDRVNATNGEYFDRRNAEFLAVPASDLKWVHCSTTIADDICYDADMRTIRWNNWMTEPDVTGRIYTTNYSNAVMATLGGDFKDGRSGWDMMNTVAATTPRTPLGVFNIKADKINDRYIPHYYDDNKWHTWKFIWNDKFTACYIDGQLVRHNRTCIPFIPMPFLIGGWFPSDNSWGDYANKGFHGTWAGVRAEWDIYHWYIRRIKYRHFTEDEAPRTQMLYHAESYPYSGLREIVEPVVYNKVTISVVAEPQDAVIKINGKVQNSIVLNEGDNYKLEVSAAGYITKTETHVANVTETIVISLEKKPIPKVTFEIVPNPSNATVVINGQTVNKVTINQGYEVSYSVTAEGYDTVSAKEVVNNNTIKQIELIIKQPKKYTLTIESEPSNAIVTMNGTQGNVQDFDINTVVNYEVTLVGYSTKTGTVTISNNQKIFVILIPMYIVNIRAIPSDAYITINNINRNNLIAKAGTAITYKVEKQGYVTITNSFILTKNEDIIINLIKELPPEENTKESVAADIARVVNNIKAIPATAENKIVFTNLSDIHSQLVEHDGVPKVGADFIKTSVDTELSIVRQLKDHSTVLGMFSTGDIVDRINYNNHTVSQLIANLRVLSNWHNNDDGIDFAFTPGNHDIRVFEATNPNIDGLVQSAKVFDFAQADKYRAKYPQSANTYHVYEDKGIIVALYDFYNYKTKERASTNGYWKTMTDDIKAILNNNPTYKVIIFSHQPADVNNHTAYRNEELAGINPTYASSISPVRDTKYVYDTLGSDKIIASIHGHKHSDILHIKQGFPIIHNTVAGQLLIQGGNRTPYYDGIRKMGYTVTSVEKGTLAEVMVNVYCWNKETNELYIYRVGPGPDVVVKLENGKAKVTNLAEVYVNLNNIGINRGNRRYVAAIASPMFNEHTDKSVINPQYVANDTHKYTVGLMTRDETHYHTLFMPVGWRYFIVAYNLSNGTYGNVIDLIVSENSYVSNVPADLPFEGLGPSSTVNPNTPPPVEPPSEENPQEPPITPPEEPSQDTTEIVLSTEKNPAVYNVFVANAAELNSTYGINVEDGITIAELGKITTATLTSTKNSMFKDNHEITTFNEAQYFTGLKGWKGEITFGDRFVDGCENLTEITMPANLKHISSRTFEDCFNLSDIILLSTTVPTINDQTAFGKYRINTGTRVVGNKTIWVPDGTEEAYNSSTLNNGAVNYLKTVAVDQLGYVIKPISQKQ